MYAFCWILRLGVARIRPQCKHIFRLYSFGCSTLSTSIYAFAAAFFILLTINAVPLPPCSPVVHRPVKSIWVPQFTVYCLFRGHLPLHKISTLIFFMAILCGLFNSFVCTFICGKVSRCVRLFVGLKLVFYSFCLNIKVCGNDCLQNFKKLKQKGPRRCFKSILIFVWLKVFDLNGCTVLQNWIYLKIKFWV